MADTDTTTEHGSHGWTVGSDAGPLLLTAAQVGELLQVGSAGAKHLHSVGALKGFVVARKLRFRPADVHAYVNSLGTEGAR